jgi:hypothetical protein
MVSRTYRLALAGHARWRRWSGAARTVAAHAGLRQPIVPILLVIAFNSAIAGKPLDGLFMLLVTTGLAWDAGTRYRSGLRQVPEGTADDGAVLKPAAPDSPVYLAAPESLASPDSLAGLDSPGPAASARRSRLLGVAVLAGGALFAVVVGSFPRYSWPATVGVAGLGAAVLVIGWRGHLRARPVPPSPGRLGVALWGGLLVAGGLWELAALLEQPSITTSSAVHPTISTLTDPLLASPAGRSVALAIWLVLGCFLVLR